MSVFADAYSRYLTNNFNYTIRSKVFRKYFRTSLVFMTDPKFMTKSFIDQIDDFPKYPYFFHPMRETESIDLIKIYNTSMDNTDELVGSMVGISQLSKKELYDKIPILSDDILEEVCFQFSFISNSTDLYNYDLILRSFVSEYQYRNFYSDLYSDLYYSTDQVAGDTSGLEDKAFSYEYILYSCLYNVISSSHDIYTKTLIYLRYINSSGMIADRVDKTAMLTGFQTFTNTHQTNMSIDLADIIGKSMYDYQKISPIMMQNLQTIINNKIVNVTSGLYQAFYQLMNAINSLSPVEIITSNVTNQLNAFIATDIASRIYDDPAIVNQVQMSSETLFEENEFNAYINKISQVELKNYLFLCFLYKFWPVKFLNIMQLTLKEYVEDYIKTTNDYTRTKEDYASVLKLFCSNYIDYDGLETFLDNNILPMSTLITYPPGTAALFTFTPGSATVQCTNIASFAAISVHEYIYASGDDRTYAGHVVSKDIATLTLSLDNEYTGTISTADVQAYKYSFDTSSYIYNVGINYNVAEFGCLMYYDFVLNTFFESTYYDTFIEELTEVIFTYLRDTGHISYSFDWYRYHDVVDIYFKVYMRWKLLDISTRCILSDFSSARASFTYNSIYVYCANEETYNLILDGDYIFAENDSIDNANRVVAHIDPVSYIIQLTSVYTGTTTINGTHTNVYRFDSTSVSLFNNVTNNFANKLFPKVLSNSTASTDYDIDMTFPSSTVLKTRFSAFASSSAFINGMYRFTENLQLSTLTREIIYSMLTEFIPDAT
jgi:hypothetical protein